MHDESHSSSADHRLASSLPAPTGPYRSLSARRLRDPSHRKSVSFNDVPIVHEVPSFDTMRNSNCDTFRSWTFTDATPAIPVASTPQILSPFHSTSAAAQKIHANRLSSALYSSTNSTIVPRSITIDWSTKTKPTRTADESIESSSSIWNPPVIVVHTPDERANKPAITDTTDEKKSSYRSPIVPDTDHYRSLPFTYTPVSDSTTTYTSMISTNVIPSTEPSSPITPRPGRARSATLPITVIHSSLRHPPPNNENISITPFRTPATASLTTGLSSTSRTVLKPTTIAFQCSQLSSNTSPVLSPSNPLTSKSLARPSSSSVHSRLISSSNRPMSSSMKYTSPYATAESLAKASFGTISRSRSANVSNPRRYHSTSPVAPHDGNSHSNFIATGKRNPNVRQTYGSYYMHRVLLPANIN